MWYKTLHLDRVYDAVALALPVLNETLQEQAFRPLASVEAKRMGWIAPAGRSSEVFVYEVNGQRLFSAQRQERLLPASVDKEEAESRAAEREEAERRALRRQEKQSLKEKFYEEFLPRAFVRSWRFDLWWDTTRNLIAVNASSRKRAVYLPRLGVIHYEMTQKARKWLYSTSPTPLV